jgi:hypothetical protein
MGEIIKRASAFRGMRINVEFGSMKEASLLRWWAYNLIDEAK